MQFRRWIHSASIIRLGENGGSSFIRNVGVVLLNYMTLLIDIYFENHANCMNTVCGQNEGH